VTVVSSDLLSVEDALAAVLGAIPGPLPAEELAPEAALGRWLASPVVATTDLPPWDNSAMDGYAIRAADTAAATEGSPIRLGVIGEIAAGAWPALTVAAGTALGSRPGRGSCRGGRGRARRFRADAEARDNGSSRASGRPAAVGVPRARAGEAGWPGR
jgi:hypothetical protein